MNPLLIAEIGVNHDGNVDRAESMVRECGAAGFDAAKFQYWHVDELLASEAPTAAYQGHGDQRELLASLRLDLDALSHLQKVARQSGVEFIVTPDGGRACEDLVQLGVDRLKIGSGDADNPWLMALAVSSGLPLIISTGMMTGDELSELLLRLEPAVDVTLLHCVSAYPTPLEEIALQRMRELAVSSGRPVGLSDHTIGLAAAAAAVALGAAAIEKHVTWSTAAPGPDHAMSLALGDAGEWVNQIRSLAIGLQASQASTAELANRSVVRKALHLARNVAAGEFLDAGSLVPLRPLLDGIPAGDRDRVVGRPVNQHLSAGHRLRESDLG